MPVVNKTPAVAARPTGKNQTAGNLTVKYIDAKGRSFDAISLGAGTSSGLKLKINTRQGASRIMDNVPLGTTLNAVNCYKARI